MTEQYYFLAENGRPFMDWGAAHTMRQTLLLEVGCGDFEIVPHPDGGFAVVNAEAVQPEVTSGIVEPACGFPEAPRDALLREMAASHVDTEPPPIGGLLPPMTSPELRNADSTINAEAAPELQSVEQDNSQGFDRRFTLRVTPRAFVRLHLLAMVGIALMLFPHWLFAPLGDFSGFQSAALNAYVYSIVRMGGAMLAIVALGKFLYAYLLYRFVVTEDSVEANLGWIARDAPKVFYAHIRTTSVVQSWWERLLVVGAVKIGTGATDQHEVVLKHIANPKRIELELERRYLPFIRSQQRFGRVS